MDHSPQYRSRRREEGEFNLREWGLKARISRENTNSRRYSASYIRSFREDTRSFRSNITISSTASSPGYSLIDEIDPSTYSFTTAIQALQARSAAYNCWECLSPDGFALNSKWNEAEKYICNPLSGEVPMECLSAKTLSGRSFRNLTNRITMSAPLIYSSSSSSSLCRQIQTRPSNNSSFDDTLHQFPILEKRMEAMTRDVGTQSTPPDLSSSILSPASTPPIKERSLKRRGIGGDSPNSNAKVKSEEQVNVKETSEEEETKKEEEKTNEKDELKRRHGGCLSWMSKRHREKQKPRNKFFLPKLKGC
ncbi:mental retardation GTPase activating protein [Parasponia andersonii]|uniref:Mental retardation GTPase activating protein n=1 Tax=Parasponia andersonii TaxID=3476 RepID=A0A2P5DY34_PARAD|nr:mental retardation GTPase activating protein [Parasponia andersonii]